MEKKLVSYETMYIVDCTGTEEATAALVNKFKTLIEENGTVESFDEWGKRKLAYPINDLTEGYYDKAYFIFRKSCLSVNEIKPVSRQDA